MIIFKIHGNLGTIIRTLDASGNNCLVLSKGTVDPYNSKVIRSTMGAIFRINIFQLDKELTDYLSELKENNFDIYTTSLKAKEMYFDVSYTGKFAIIMGNESQGVSNEAIKHANKLIKIPMPRKGRKFKCCCCD